MRIYFISSIAADNSSPTYTLDCVSETDNPITLRWKLYNEYDIHPACILLLVYGTHLLKDDQLLITAGVGNNCCLRYILRNKHGPQTLTTVKMNAEFFLTSRVLDSPVVDCRVYNLLNTLSSERMANSCLHPKYTLNSTLFSFTQIAMIQDMLKSIVVNNSRFTTSSSMSFGIDVVDLIWYIRLIDGFEKPCFHSNLLKEKFNQLFKAVPDAGDKYKLIMTWESGSTNIEDRPLSFGCLSPTNSSTIEVSISSWEESSGGGTYFYSMETLTKYNPTLGSILSYPPNVLRAEAPVGGGAKLTLNIVDKRSDVYTEDITQINIKPFARTMLTRLKYGSLPVTFFPQNDDHDDLKFKSIDSSDEEYSSNCCSVVDDDEENKLLMQMFDVHDAEISRAAR
jgi:hypothetical protein